MQDSKKSFARFMLEVAENASRQEKDAEFEKLKELTLKVQTNEYYNVSYVIDNDGNRINEGAWLLGEDLTAGQILDLHERGLL